MKRTIALLGSLLLFASGVFSQKTSFGVKLGVASNYLTFKVGDDEQEYQSNNTRPFIAGVAHIQVSENFAIQPNLLVIMKGGSIEGTKINTTHIDVPVNFLFTKNGFFAGGGPNFSYGIVGKVDLGNEDVSIYDQEKAEELTLKRFELGGNIIMGYMFPGGFTVSANYTPGLLDIYKGAEGSDDDIKAHMKTFAFTIGYMFGQKKK